MIDSMEVWTLTEPFLEEVVATARCEDSPGCMAERARRQRGEENVQALLGIIPGYGWYRCANEDCSTLEWVIATAENVPGLRFLRIGCGCFEEGTLVATPGGLRPIEEIEVGDLVIAWDEATGQTSAQRVTALIRPEPKLLWRLQLRDADGEIETFHVTDDHPWYVEGASWVETQHLRAGQRIETADDRGLLILDLARTDRAERTYNLEVAGFHTFLVGEDGAVVHNCRLPFTINLKIFRDMTRRGWSSSDIQRALNNPARTVATRDTRHLPGGGRMNDPATAYYSAGGGYVVRNDVTGQIVQVSGRGSGWSAPWGP